MPVYVLVVEWATTDLVNVLPPTEHDTARVVRAGAVAAAKTAGPVAAAALATVPEPNHPKHPAGQWKNMSPTSGDHSAEMEMSTVSKSIDGRPAVDQLLPTLRFDTANFEL